MIALTLGDFAVGWAFLSGFVAGVVAMALVLLIAAWRR